MNEYFMLHGIDTSIKMKDKIDRAFRPLINPSPERYAEMTHNRLGHCPLLLPNGYCELHSKLGEDALPSICRLYPRAPKFDYHIESSCANSCERTLELLFENEEPISFETIPLSFKLSLTSKSRSEEERRSYKNLRDKCFQILSNRRISLSTRILQLGKLFATLDLEPNYDYSDFFVEIPKQNGNRKMTFELLLSLCDFFKEKNPSITDYCVFTQNYFQNEDILSFSTKAINHFDSVITNHEILLEKAIINELFFRQFPFQEYTRNFTDEFISLCGMVSFVQFLSITMMTEKTTIEDYIDIMATIFRAVTHTRFEQNIMILLKNEGFADFEHLSEMLNSF